MYKEDTENVEVYFICNKKHKMELIETYYDEVLDIHSWYFNTYLAYQYWKQDFKTLELGDISRMLLTVAASRYIIYSLETKEYKNKKEHQRLLSDLSTIEPQIENIIKINDFILKDLE
ncbi:MAG: hypothetical protein HFI36_02360 [Bacilli bacterium]|jgi:hypothetical protein|nr:hypothetical protein [Bacilli bacterium]